MARKHRRLLWIAGAGVGAYVAYRYVYRPWADARALAALPGGAAAGAAGGGTSPAILPNYPNISFPNPLNMLTPPAPPITAPVTSTPAGVPTTQVPSIGATVPGLVGVVMRKKNWTQQQAQTRLDQLVAGAQNARAQITALSSASSNPAAAGIPAAQAALAASQAALAVAQQAYNQLVAAGDANGAALYHAAILGHQNDINELNARIAAASTANDNTAAIAAYEGALASLDNDYFALTDTHLIGGV